jgi:hypothetical protein
MISRSDPAAALGTVARTKTMIKQARQPPTPSADHYPPPPDPAAHDRQSGPGNRAEDSHRSRNGDLAAARPPTGLPCGPVGWLAAEHYAVARIFCRSSSTIMAPEGPRPRNQTSSSTGRAWPFCTAFSRLHSSPFTTAP